MDTTELKRQWLAEEGVAHIQGWDFSHIEGRYAEEQDLPWDYAALCRSALTPETRLLDYDTGGGEFLLSLGHDPRRTAATEGYPPNVALCEERLLPLGIDFRACDNAAALPFEDDRFDLILNRHGDFDAKEAYRVLKPGGLFLTQQVGEDNDRELVELVLPGTPKPYPGMNLAAQRAVFEAAGFTILRAEEAFRPIVFSDVGAFVWFCRIIEWEFPGFSVERCFDRLLDLQRRIEAGRRIEGTVHRYLIMARKRERSE